MHTRKIAHSSFALAFGLVFGLAGAGLAASSMDSPAAADSPKAAEKACCPHHDSAGDKAGMHCDHARMKGHGMAGKACCAESAAMHKEGAPADSMAGCAKHEEMMKDGAPADTKACCAQHAAMTKDGDKAGCCCCDGAACEHHAAEEAPAKS